MPIGHVVTFTFHPDTSAETITALSDALDALAAACSGIDFYRHGPDLQAREGNADFALSSVFSDQEAFTTYMTAPAHQRIITELVQPNVSAKSSVQFEIR